MIRKKPEDTVCFHFHNANPKGKRTTDCVVRAIATATEQSWDDTFDGLARFAKKYALMIDDTSCYGKYLASLGWKKQRQPRKDDNKKYTGKEFCEMWHKCPWIFTGKENDYSGTVIAHIGGHHIVCIKRGVIFDTWNSSRRCIGNYWTKE